MATRRTPALSEGGTEGDGLLVNTYAALISSGANISQAGKSGPVRPNRINRVSGISAERSASRSSLSIQRAPSQTPPQPSSSPDSSVES